MAKKDRLLNDQSNEIKTLIENLVFMFSESATEPWVCRAERFFH